MIQKVCCLINPSSGNKAGSRLIAELKEIADRYFPKVEIVETSLELLDQQVKLASRSDLILIGGGDGTISQVVNRLYPTEAIVGIIPLGTANDLSRELGIDKLFKQAGLAGLLAHYRNAPIRDLSLWRLEYGFECKQSRLFCNYVSFGFDASVVAECERWRGHLGKRPFFAKRIFTKFLYALAAFKQLLQPGYPQVTIKALDDEFFQQHLFPDWRGVFVSNVRAVMGWGVANQSGSPFDNNCEVQIVKSILNYLCMLASYKLPLPKPVLLDAAKGWEIDGFVDTIAVQVDGEYASEVKCQKCRIMRTGKVGVLVANQ